MAYIRHKFKNKIEEQDQQNGYFIQIQQI